MGGFSYGWYLKCQSGTQALEVIPAIHKTEKTGTRLSTLGIVPVTVLGLIQTED